MIINRFALIIGLLLIASCKDIKDIRLEQLEKELELYNREELPIYHQKFDEFIDDHTPIEIDFIYNYIAKKLSVADQNEIGKITNKDFKYDDLMNLSSKHRGKFFKVMGTIADMEVIKLPDGSQVPEIHAGVFFTSDRKPILFHLIEKPDLLYLREDTILINGLFIKLITHETKRGDKITIPFFMAKNLQKYY